MKFLVQKSVASQCEVRDNACAQNGNVCAKKSSKWKKISCLLAIWADRESVCPSHKNMKTTATTLLSLSLALIASAAEVKVELTGNDQMQFSTKAIEAKVGDKLLITFKNVGKLPVVAMGHNVVILKPGTELPAFAMKCMTEKDNNYITKDETLAKAVIAHSKVLGPGESEVVTFEAKEAGVYPYLCTFPGHFAVMNGTITVK